MAIKIPILTSFDPKGLKQANAAFAGLQTSMASLGRNFAVVGAGIAGTTALLGKAVMSASNFEAEFEGVNQVFKDAAGSVQAFAEQAAKSTGLSATEALQASKTFGLFATGAGLGVQEAAKFSTTMVQLAGDLGSFNDVPTAEALAAIQSGLMGQAEPLRKFGVFLDDARLKTEALNMGIYDGSGPLSTQQKMMASYSAILAQTTVQQGDFVKYGDTLGNQLKTISSDFQNLTRDIGMMLIPVITEAMPVISQMATDIGEKLKGAIESIDWKSLIQSVVDFTVFIVTNAEMIARLVAGIFILNTAFKLMAVASGIAKTAIAIQTWVTAQLAAGMTFATIATNLLSAAMRLIPFVAAITGISLVVTGIMQLGDQANRNKPYVDNYGGAIRKTGNDALWAAQAYGIASQELDNLNDAIAKPKDSESRNRRHALRDANRRAGLIGSGYMGGPNFAASLPDFSSIVAASVGSGAGDNSFAKELDRLQKEAEKAAKDAEKAMQQIEKDAQTGRERAADAEQAVLDKRLNAFESFNNSVKNLFGQIKDNILSSFNLPTLGNSVNSITRNIAKLLERTKNFARNISQLSGLGLNSALLQQVIQAGPMAGSQLASALVGGGSGFVDQINRAYNEFGNLAGGIAGVGTTGAFAGQQTVNNYSIEVTGGLATGSDVGRAVVNAIKDYERQSGAAWRA
jgi:hypothetical protein